jgi:hypothetical protein
MKFVLFSVKDALGVDVGVAGATEEGSLLDPFYLEGKSVEEVAKAVAESIKAADRTAKVSFTEQPDIHPLVMRAIKLAASAEEEDTPEILVEGFLCQSCTHARVCAVASAIMTLRTVDIRITTCEAYTEKKKEKPND